MLFTGINLAIWFNNWNEKRKLNTVIRKSIGFIELELQSNLEILKADRSELENLYSELSLYYSREGKRSDSEIIQLNKTNKMIRVNEDGGFSLKYNYPLLNLKNTSWEIFKNRDAFNKLNYQCIYDLETCYQLINRFQNEFDKSHNNLQNVEIKKFTSTLNYITQINPQLQTLIKKTLVDLKNCN